jgi:hypothetical protein
MTNAAIKYMHQLGQFTGRLRESLAELSDWQEHLHEELDAGTPIEELRAAYSEFLKHSVAQDSIDDLTALIAMIREDDTMTNLTAISSDIASANTLVLELCRMLFNLSKQLAG